jgi:hypothetical protein
MRPQISLILLLCLDTPAATAMEGGSLRATAIIERRQVSEDVRYALSGQALRKLEPPSTDRRYVLKASAATCSANTASVFRNGFEALLIPSLFP